MSFWRPIQAIFYVMTVYMSLPHLNPFTWVTVEKERKHKTVDTD